MVCRLWMASMKGYVVNGDLQKMNENLESMVFSSNLLLPAFAGYTACNWSLS